MTWYQQNWKNREGRKSFQIIFIASPGDTICCLWLFVSFKATVKTHAGMNLSPQILEGHGRDVVLLNYYHTEFLQCHHVNMHSCLITVHHGEQDEILKLSSANRQHPARIVFSEETLKKTNLLQSTYVRFNLFLKKKSSEFFDLR